MNRINRQFLEHCQLVGFLALAIVSFLPAGCSKKSGEFTPPPEVSVVKAEAEKLPVTTVLPGRIDSVRTAQVRARVAGILLKEVYREGSDVKAGDVLFQIDSAPVQSGQSLSGIRRRLE